MRRRTGQARLTGRLADVPVPDRDQDTEATWSAA